MIYDELQGLQVFSPVKKLKKGTYLFMRKKGCDGHTKNAAALSSKDILDLSKAIGQMDPTNSPRKFLTKLGASERFADSEISGDNIILRSRGGYAALHSRLQVVRMASAP